MTNRSPEQELINQFVQHLEIHTDNALKIRCILNQSCKARKFADIEFQSETNIHWVIEAKSNDSRDKYNTVHKIFGELLKETGRDNRINCRYAILIPESALMFYSRTLQSINRTKFVDFGLLIPVDTVFTSSINGINQYTWESLYDLYSPS